MLEHLEREVHPQHVGARAIQNRREVTGATRHVDRALAREIPAGPANDLSAPPGIDAPGEHAIRQVVATCDPGEHPLDDPWVLPLGL